ncbi:pseudouridine synthase family protein [Wolffia australiana]
MLSQATRAVFLVSTRAAAAAAGGGGGGGGARSPRLGGFPRPFLRLLSSATPYPLYYELISYRPTHRPRRRRRRRGDPPTALFSAEDGGGGEAALDKAQKKYYRKREKRLFGESESDGEGAPSDFVELEPDVVDFPRLHAREEELYFYDAMAFPWEKDKHYGMVYQLEKKYFPEQSLDKAFLEDGAPKKAEEGRPGRGRREGKGLVFFDKATSCGEKEKKVEEFFDCLKKVPSSAASGEPWLASRGTGLPPRWDSPSGTVLLVDKPKGWTSFTVCGKLRRLVKIQKVGHAGTLDPMATGLLIVCVGKATKVVDRYQAMFKSYSGIFRLGEATSTWDADSPVIQREPWEHIKDEDIKKAAESFCGEIWQVPPMFSAIKVGGEKLYEKARRGETVELSPRRISIFQFDIERSLEDRQNLIFRVTCSKGTYIRSLCADLGKALGSCAHLTALRRDSIGQYSVDDAWDFQELQAQITKGYL